MPCSLHLNIQKLANSTMINRKRESTISKTL